MSYVLQQLMGFFKITSCCLLYTSPSERGREHILNAKSMKGITEMTEQEILALTEEDVQDVYKRQRQP